MANYNEQIRRLYDRFEKAIGTDDFEPDDFIQWCLDNKLWVPRPQDIKRQMRADLSEAMRQAMRVDADGITYRAKQFLIDTDSDGTKRQRWFDTDTAPRNLMHKAVRQRRDGVVRDAYRLKSDVDHFNNQHGDEEPIPLLLDFADDVAEVELEERSDDKKAA